MVDFHTHILPGVDDGSRTEKESVIILEQAEKAGFTDVIATSHYLEEYYEVDEEIRKDLLKKIKSQVEVKLHLGNELYITRNIEELLKNHKVSTINNSKYLLMELPFNNQVIFLNEVIYKMLSLGIIPIIAHPERYEYVQKDPSQLQELIDSGVLFQMNYGSIIGQFGKKAQKTAKYLLKNDYIHFLGSDTHRVNGVYLQMQKILKKIEKIVGKEKTYRLTELNPRCVLENRDIEL